jgi:hypothetical protein
LTTDDGVRRIRTLFKQKTDYLMQMDVEVDYAPAEAMLDELGLTLEQARQEGLASLIRHVVAAAKDGVREAGQKWRGEEVDPAGEWPRFSIKFQGDSDGALKAYEGWANRVETLNGTKRVLKASLRGSDGTNLQYMDEELQKEYAALEASMSPEDLAMIDKLMDPEA